MKKLIFGGLFLAAMVTGFVGCKKMNTDINNPNNLDVQSDFGFSRTENPYDILGQIHNDALMTMMEIMVNSELSVDDTMFRKRLRSCVLSDFAYLDGSKHFTENYVNYAFESYDYAKDFNFNISEWETCPLSINAKGFIHEIDELIHTMAVENIHFSVIVAEIDELVSNVNTSSLRGFELQVVLGYIYISKYSTEFWAPEELGGMGMYDYYFSSIENRASPEWERAKKADAASSATYMLNSAVVLAAGWVPAVGIGWLGGWGVSTAIGSTFGYFS